ncbi:MAG: M14 family metallopeptidase [Acidobacteria bacterium]|nr:M14 family metallopeptidase [Acidobacteriota bacterium]
MAQTQDDRLKSRAESTKYEETSRYQDVMQFIGELQKRAANMRIESFGKTEEDRDLPLLIFANPPVSDPTQAKKSGKPVVFIMANIHAGEVEGKEAMLHLSRRLAVGDLRTLLNKLIILIAPIYNADGNEKISLDNRTAQNGPIGGVGVRGNSKGLDLNRDFMKLESREANALIGLLNRWDPHMVVDLHTTNGSYHGYHLTYAPPLNPNTDSRLTDFERGKMLPAITKAMLDKHKFRTYYYGNFATQERMDREVDAFREETKIWRTFDHRPRFGNNYCGLRNRLAILSEAYSYLDFKNRIAVTEAFVEEILKYTSAHSAEIVALIKRVDQDAIAGKIAQAGIAIELKPADKSVEILTGKVEKINNPKSGKMMTAMLEEKVTPVKMLEYGQFRPVRSVAISPAYIFRNEEGMRIITDKLRSHGIAFEELSEPKTIEVESFLIENISRAARAFQGHSEVSLKGSVRKENLQFPKGSIIVHTAQPKAPLIFYLLEAESDDGFVNWNFLDSYLEIGKTYPIYKFTR